MTVRRSRISVVALALASSIGVAACGSSSNGGSGGSTGSANTIVGAGSTLIAPLMSQWQPAYSTATGVTITYGAIGSGAGIEQITARTVDIGASDAPLTPDQATAAKGVVQIPWALAGTAVAYNVSGLSNQLKLTGPLLAAIYQGQVTNWNDPQIAKLNPGVKLPDLKITPVYRSDGSGDTYAFTNYLSHVSPAFKSKVGVSTQVKFPTGTGAEKSDGVAAAVSQTDGAIGYLGLAYISSNGLQYGLVQNSAGQFPNPDVASITAAAAAVKGIGKDNAISLTGLPASAKDAYPISTYTYIIVPLKSDKADELKKFITYAIGPGQAFGPDLNFAPLPSQVVAADKKAIAKIGS
jgi:phosphate transport system substrate-binding protein